MRPGPRTSTWGRTKTTRCLDRRSPAATSLPVARRRSRSCHSLDRTRSVKQRRGCAGCSKLWQEPPDSQGLRAHRGSANDPKFGFSQARLITNARTSRAVRGRPPVGFRFGGQVQCPATSYRCQPSSSTESRSSPARALSSIDRARPTQAGPSGPAEAPATTVSHDDSEEHPQRRAQKQRTTPEGSCRTPADTPGPRLLSHMLSALYRQQLRPVGLATCRATNRSHRSLAAGGAICAGASPSFESTSPISSRIAGSSIVAGTA
jgi:hypothetical protein